MAVLPGCAVLTGSLFGPFVAGLFATAGLPITWFEYARVMALPTVIWCGLDRRGEPGRDAAAGDVEHEPAGRP